MCGIIGYIGHRPAVTVVMEGLERLEYRGYDSAGIAWIANHKICNIKSAGKLQMLADKIAQQPGIISTSAIGHTRWATHGAPVESNAHPHLSNDKSFAIIHNGIIENYKEIKSDLLKKGYIFHSETDTEVLVNLIAEKRKTEPDVLHAFSAALSMAHGAYAVCLIAEETPDCIYAARMSAPLIFGVGTGENFIASDIPAFLPYCREVIFLEDGEIVVSRSSSYEIMDMHNFHPLQKIVHTIQWDMQAAQKDGYKHFMLKEIFEQPRVINDCLTGRWKDDILNIPELENFIVPERIHIVACGTSYHAGMWAKDIFEYYAGIPVEINIASEFRYKPNILINDKEFVLVISQSGETADTLAALRRVKENNITTIGICNVVGSSIAREADTTIFTQAGPEISVASTKAMTSQMVLLCLIALYWGKRKKYTKIDEINFIMSQLSAIPKIMDDNLPEIRKTARDLAKKYSNFKNFFYLGRGYGFSLALEGALKLKELSYIHAEGYASGEMKHGPIALIDPQFPSFVVAFDDDLLDKVKSNIQEIKARGGKIIGLTNPGINMDVNDIWYVPNIYKFLNSFLILSALQLFSYEVADFLGKDVDQPRNLAKSVTVE